MKIPDMSPSTSFHEGIQTIKSHWNTTFLTFCSWVLNFCTQEFENTKRTMNFSQRHGWWGKNLVLKQNPVSAATAMFSGILLFLRKPFHDELWNVLRQKSMSGVHLLLLLEKVFHFPNIKGLFHNQFHNQFLFLHIFLLLVASKHLLSYFQSLLWECTFLIGQTF